MELKLYFIAAEIDGEDYDLFAWADSPDQARRKHREHFELVSEMDTVLLFEIPTTPPTHAKALAWHDDIKEIIG
jgi:hypothetical protein